MSGIPSKLEKSRTCKRKTQLSTPIPLLQVANLPFPLGPLHFQINNEIKLLNLERQSQDLRFFSLRAKLTVLCCRFRHKVVLVRGYNISALGCLLVLDNVGLPNSASSISIGS